VRVRGPKVWTVESLEGQNPRKVTATRLGATRVSENGLAEGKRSFEAEGAGSRRRSAVGDPG